jgi:hypothetical protein
MNIFMFCVVQTMNTRSKIAGEQNQEIERKKERSQLLF